MTAFERINSKGKKEYYIRFKIDGKEYYHTVKTATNKKAAEEVEQVILGELRQGRYNLVNNKGNMPFEKIVTAYREYSKLNKKTYKVEEGKVNRISGYFKGYSLKDITPQVVEDFKKWRKNTVIGKGCHKGELTKGTTVNRDLALLKKMFSIAVQNKWMDENPALNCKVKMFTEDNEIIRYLTDEEEKRLLEACKGDYAYLKPMVKTAINTGMRYGELIKLRWKENIDFKSCFIILTADMTKAKKKRMIPISSVLMKEFEELYTNRLSDYVFTNPKTLKPYHTIRKSFQKVKMIAEIDPDFRWHDLRHHMATKLMDKNINVGVIKDILGHSTLTITQKYAHAMDTTKRMAVELLAISLS